MRKRDVLVVGVESLEKTKSVSPRFSLMGPGFRRSPHLPHESPLCERVPPAAKHGHAACPFTSTAIHPRSDAVEFAQAAGFTVTIARQYRCGKLLLSTIFTLPPALPFGRLHLLAKNAKVSNWARACIDLFSVLQREAGKSRG